jgi:hypothetical protein
LKASTKFTVTRDLVVTGKISLTGENFVERFKQSFGEAIEYLRILVTD